MAALWLVHQFYNFSSSVKAVFHLQIIFNQFMLSSFAKVQGKKFTQDFQAAFDYNFDVDDEDLSNSLRA